MRKIFLPIVFVGMVSAAPAFAMQCNYLGVCFDPAGYASRHAMETMPDNPVVFICLSGCCLLATARYASQTDCCGQLGQAFGLVDKMPVTGVAMGSSQPGACAGNQETLCAVTASQEQKKEK